MQGDDKLLWACEVCGTANRVPRDRLGEDPKCGQCHSALVTGRPVELDVARFDPFLERNSLPVLVDFWADWCAPCKAMAPAFARVAADMKTAVRFAKLDTERSQSTAARFGIRAIPTLMLFKDGKEVARVSGALDAKSLSVWLARVLGA